MRVWAPLAILIVLTTLLTPLAIHIPRHVNPNNVVSEKPFPQILAILYLGIFSNIASLNTDNASRILKMLSNVYVPPQLRYVFTRFNELIKELISDLNETKNLVNLVKQRIAINDVVGASKALSRARRIVEKSWATYYELRDASRELVRLGISIPRLTSMLRKCGEALKRLEYEIGILEESLSRVEGLTKPVLIIDAYPRTIWVGSYVAIVGKLVVDSIGLGNRTIVLHVGNTITILRTDTHGFFNTSIRIEQYKHVVTIYAEYVPTGLDKLRYCYTRSNTIDIHVKYVETPLLVKPRVIETLPNTSITISIETLPNTVVSISNPFNSRTELINVSQGILRLRIEIPSNVGEGIYRLRIEALSHGIYAPNVSIVTIVVHKLRPLVKLSIPSTVLTGFSIWMGLSITPKSRLEILIPEIGFSKTLSIGNASIRIHVPLLFLGNSLSIHLKVVPLDPRYRAIEIDKRIHVYNTLCASISLTSPPLIVTAMLRRRRVRTDVLEIVEAREFGIVSKATTLVRDPITKLIIELLEMLRNLTGLGIKHCETLREYIRRISERVPPTMRSALHNVLHLIERYLYGDPSRISSGHVVKLVENLRKLVNELRRGSVG